jgi:hypothetical protein
VKKKKKKEKKRDKIIYLTHTQRVHPSKMIFPHNTQYLTLNIRVVLTSDLGKVRHGLITWATPEQIISLDLLYE